MKNLILLFSIILSFSSCSQNDEGKRDNNSIIGAWKLVEIYSSDGGSNPQWNQINNGFTYTFYNNGDVKSSKFNCDGKYKINTSNSLHIEFDCDDSKMKGNFDFTFLENNLIFTLNPNTCIEGCTEKFMKIEE
ncbi:hypothetical protein [Mariniflexile sp.]|uniref:hypothetical protein n=1 Tax=Mariniflexile sp. TaxID=1979402 RepID=UPI004048E2BF